jgi:hypothetical protein
MENILANILAFTEGGKTTKDLNLSKVRPDAAKSATTKSILVTKTSDAVLGIICFSKERPFQLHQFLLSLAYSFDKPADKIMVIYVPGQFENLYSRVFSMHPNVIAVKETNFQTDLLECVNSLPSESNVIFCVDDLLFVNKLLIR